VEDRCAVNKGDNFRLSWLSNLCVALHLLCVAPEAMRTNTTGGMCEN